MLLSIITVNYNNAHGLESTIKSVIDQTWQEFEFIVIDGGSTDESKEVIKKYENQLAYWCSEKDNGIYNAMNKGIGKSRGAYLYFLNSGDKLNDTSTLMKVSEKLNKPDIVYGNLLIVEPGKSWTKYYDEKLGFEYFTRDTLPHQGSFIKRSLFDKMGLYDESLKIVADWKFFLDAICVHRIQSLYLDMVIAHYDYTGISSRPEFFELQKREKHLVLNNEYPQYYGSISELHELRRSKSFYDSFKKDFFVQKYFGVKLKWQIIKRKFKR